MSRILFAVYLMALLLPRDSYADDGPQTDVAVAPIVPGIPIDPFVIGNRDEPTDTQLLAFAKIFCVALRKLNNDASKRGALRVFVDPRYLDRHKLHSGAFPVETIAVRSLYNIEMADDRRTAICQIETSKNPAEILILRLTLHEGKLFLNPVAPPDAKTGSFTAWIYRLKRNVPVPPGARR